MNDTNEPSADDQDMRPEYDFSKAEVGKYYDRYRRGTNLVLLADDVARDFPTAESVNQALRRYRQMMRKSRPA
jgi:hypothetical protein